MSRRRIAVSDRVLGLKKMCPICGDEISSNGQLLYTPNLKWWSVGYFCPVDREVIWASSPATDAVVAEATRGIDIDTLPYEPFVIFDDN